jgi:hypothetical protein
VRYAVILGRHDDVWKELDAAKDLIRSVDSSAPIHVLATKRAGRDYDGPVHEWPGFHPELFPGWIEERARNNRPPAQRYWSARPPQLKNPDGHGVPFNWLISVGGSSGLLGIQVALAIGYPPYNVGESPINKAILCGMPMTKSTRYDDKKQWSEAEFYRDHWIVFFRDRPQDKNKFRSWSGWTAEFFGTPDEEWLRAK